MNRSTVLAGLMVLAAASSAAAQNRRAAPAHPSLPVIEQAACPQGSYSVIRAPDGASVSVLFHDFSAESSRAGQISRTTCRIEIPLAVPAGYSAGLTSVDYRGFAVLGVSQAAEVAVDYEVGRGNRAPRFQRQLQGAQQGDFVFTDRLPPGRMRSVGCGSSGPAASVLAINAALTLTDRGTGDQAMIALDSADQATKGALRYRFDVRPCPRGGRMTTTAEIASE